MNKIAITSVLAVMTGLAGAPQTAKAHGDDALAVIGGFIGGVIVANSINDHHNHVQAYCEFDGCRDRYVVAHSHYAPRQSYVTVRVWVPGRWIIRYDDRGRRARFYERGRYEYRRHAVAYDSHRGRDYDRHSYGHRG